MDPLFRKTSADFDEGGARGLLLNHLSVDRDCKLIFDASDAKFGDDKEGDNVEKDDNEVIDISKLRCGYIYFLIVEFRLLYWVVF